MSKPPLHIPTMAEIRATAWNGFSCASTFSGGGGSSTGYRIAGFRVLYANEFIDEARETYRANCAPYTFVDGRDIRQVKGSDILEAIKLQPGELDLFDGSPPCSSFSTAGKREKGWGEVKKYSDKVQRSDDLFFEYIRLLGEIRPKTFVAENVSGLVKGTAKGYFLEILAALKASGYRVSCRLLDAQWLGVPQARTRTIFVGVREDIGIDPVHPKPLPYRYTLRDAFGPNLRIGPVEPETDISRFAIGNEWDKIAPGGQSEKFFQLCRPALDAPVGTITQTAGSPSAAGVCHPTEKRKFSLAEVRKLCGFPEDYILTGSFSQGYERCGRAVPPVMMKHIAAAIRDQILTPYKNKGKA